MKLKFARLLTAGALVCALTTGSASAYTMLVGGTPIPSDLPTTFINDRTYVPIRAMSQLLNPRSQVTWADNTAKVTAPGLQLTAAVGCNWLEVNDRCLYVEDGIRIINGSVSVPIRVLAEAMGAEVDWDQATNTTTVVPSSSHPAMADYNETDLYWLSRIISAESQGEPLEGKLAVGTVVLNRVASDEFPDTIYDVIFDTKWGVQFTPISNKTIYNDPTPESVVAAKLCLEGARAAGDSLYFLDPTQTSNHWTMNNRTYVTTIGCHWFYS